MLNQKIDIVMINMSSYTEWETGTVNRNYHILQNLLKDERVRRILAVDFLPHTLKRGLRNYLQDQVFSHSGKYLWGDLTSKIAKINEKLFLYSSIDSAFSENLFLTKLKKVLKRFSFNRPLVWSYYPLLVGYFEKIEARLKVFDTVDDWSCHHNYLYLKDRLKKNYQIIKDKADLIFTVSPNLLSLFGNHPAKYWVPNGIDLNHFIEPKVMPADLQKLPRPIIGYLGIIQSRVDLDLVKFLAENNQDKSFVLVGPVWPDAKKEVVADLKNVHFLGPKKYQEIPAYLQHFDLGMIPHLVNDFTRSMNPLKMYEYLACAKPVVTTPVAGAEMFKGLVEVAQTYEEFLYKIEKSLNEDDEVLRQKRREAVKPHSWSARVNQMMEIISRKILNPKS